MPTVTLADAQSNLPALIDRMSPGEELLIICDDKPIARLTATDAPRPPVFRQPGSGRGELVIVSDDDDHLADFAEYQTQVEGK